MSCSSEVFVLLIVPLSSRISIVFLFHNFFFCFIGYSLFENSVLLVSLNSLSMVFFRFLSTFKILDLKSLVSKSKSGLP